MNNHPFFSTNRNIYDQSVFSTTPTNLNGQNVFVSQEQQRKLYDTLNTSIVGMQNYNSPWTNQTPGNVVQAQKQFIPGGVLFTFAPQPVPQLRSYMNTQNTQPICCCPNQNPNNYFSPTLEQQIALSGLQKHGLESLQYQQQLASNPFQLKFHTNNATSCSDLLNAPIQLPGSRSTPDFSNISGIAQLQKQGMQGNCCNPQECCKCSLMSTDTNFTPVDFSRNTKRLSLTKPEETNGRENSDTDHLNKENLESKKKVCFADEPSNTKVDKGEQVSLECPLCNAKSEFKCTSGKKKKRKSRSPVRKSRKKRDNESSSESTEEDSDKTKTNKTSNKKHKYKSDSQYYTDSEYSC